MSACKRTYVVGTARAHGAPAVEGIEGEVSMHCDLSVRFGYGKHEPWIKLDGKNATLTSGPDALAFHSPVDIKPDWDASRLEADFVVRQGDH